MPCCNPSASPAFQVVHVAQEESQHEKKQRLETRPLANNQNYTNYRKNHAPGTVHKKVLCKSVVQSWLKPDLSPPRLFPNTDAGRPPSV